MKQSYFIQGPAVPDIGLDPGRMLRKILYIYSAKKNVYTFLRKEKKLY